MLKQKWQIKVNLYVLIFSMCCEEKNANKVNFRKRKQDQFLKRKELGNKVN